MEALQSLVTALFGLALFGAAWHIHTKYRLTRLACVIAVFAGLATYASPIGIWVNDVLGNAPLILFLAVLIAIVVIVADIKGKKKGADKPALVAFFLVPLFLIGGLAALPSVLNMVGNGAERIGDRATVQLNIGK